MSSSEIESQHDPTANVYSRNKQGGDAALPKKNLLTQHRAKESLILHELSSTLHTIQNVSIVLEDIVRLTTPIGGSHEPSESRHRTISSSGISSRSSAKGSNKMEHKNNIAWKQQQLLNELRQWKEILPVPPSKPASK